MDTSNAHNEHITKMTFASVYPMYISKVEKKKASLNPSASLITGLICGYRIEEIENPLTQQVRYLDKLVDELAKGRKMEKILRGSRNSAGYLSRLGPTSQSHNTTIHSCSSSSR